MSTFQAVNTTSTRPDPPPSAGSHPGETTPTTPRPNSRFFPESRPRGESRMEDASAKTPTRSSFATPTVSAPPPTAATGLAAQLPLPVSPFTPARELSQTPSNKSDGHSHPSAPSVGSAQDVDMGEGDDDDKDGSDNESATSDINRPSKKKKGQRFFCTEFPPCNLSFTRSEHLARHIRKHTGERPFQCHCSRRFSRLDNLRQHAQTVHINEDIPAESLAATGTRFQRQIRTDRVRPVGNRARANTLGSTGGHSRGHSRNLSTSSITSTISTMTVAQSPDVRRRPPPLAMAGEGGPTARARPSLNTMEVYNPSLMGSPGPQIVEYDAQSNAPTTPTSTTYSTTNGSPARYGSGMQSPTSSSRPVSWAGPPLSGRRMSIPSPSNPFSGPPGQAPPPFITPLQSSTPTTFSVQNSVYASPTTSNFPESRRGSTVDANWKRRTWHPGTFPPPRPATSGLGYHQTPDALQPTFTTQPAATQTRLPGIESFDYAPPPPSLPRRQPSPMQLHPPIRPLTHHTPDYTPSKSNHSKRKSISWDIPVQFKRLDIGSPNPPREQYPYPSPVDQQSGARPTTAHGYFGQRQPPSMPPPIPLPPKDAPRTSMDQPETPRKNKRQAWYNGPVAHAQQGMPRTSEDSSGSEGILTPGTLPEHHPVIMHSSGHVESIPPGACVEEGKPLMPSSIMDRPHPLHAPPYRPYHGHSLSLPSFRAPPREPERLPPLPFGQLLPSTRPSDMRRLEALVAVAAGEQQATGNRAPPSLDIASR